MSVTRASRRSRAAEWGLYHQTGWTAMKAEGGPGRWTVPMLSLSFSFSLSLSFSLITSTRARFLAQTQKHVPTSMPYMHTCQACHVTAQVQHRGAAWRRCTSVTGITSTRESRACRVALTHARDFVSDVAGRVELQCCCMTLHTVRLPACSNQTVKQAGTPAAQRPGIKGIRGWPAPAADRTAAARCRR